MRNVPSFSPRTLQMVLDGGGIFVVSLAPACALAAMSTIGNTITSTFVS